MLTEFLPDPDGVVVAFTPVDAAVLADLLDQFLALLGAEEPGPGDGTLEALVGDLDGPAARPEDEALARLLPDAYPEDPEASADFRRFTESGLRATKRARARSALSTLKVIGRSQVLTPAQAREWLGALNDLRLVIGTRLGIGQDYEKELTDPAEDDPRRYGYGVYEYLTYLQETLVQALPV